MHYIVPLDGIFDKDVMPHDIKNYIMFHSKVISTMNGQSPVIRLMDRVTFDIRIMHVSNHVEMNGISSQFKGLTHVCELTVS